MKWFFSWINTHIAYKLIACVLIVIGCVMLLISMRIIEEERLVLYKQINTQGALLSKVISDSCIEPLLIRDYPVLETIAETITQNEDGISIISIERQDGSVVVEVPKGATNNTALLASSNIYSTEIKVNSDDSTSIGLLTLGISTIPAKEFVSARIRALLLNTLITFAVITLLLIFILRRFVSNPLKKLDVQAYRLGEGDLESSIILPQLDEIGRLSVTLDNMRIAQKKSYHIIKNQNIKLAQHSDELEEQVKKRTSELEEANAGLKKALIEIKTLQGIIPICASCKKIRDDKGYWNQIETYIHEHSEAEVSHGICPECAKKLYPDLDVYKD